MRITKHYYYNTITLQIFYIDVSFLGNDWSQSFKKEKGEWVVLLYISSRVRNTDSGTSRQGRMQMPEMV